MRSTSRYNIKTKSVLSYAHCMHMCVSVQCTV